MISLTRVDAAARSALIAVDSYSIDLDLTLSPDEGFLSRTVIRFTATPGSATFVDVRPRTLRHAALNGRDLGDPADGRLTLTDLAATNDLVVDAVMDYSHDGEGLHRHVDRADGEAYLYAMSFLDAAPRWFACFDQPDLKAPVKLTVRCPDHWTVAGNGPATCTEPGRWHVQATHPLATYFTTLLAGPYHSIRRQHDGIPLVLHARRSLAEHLDREADDLFAHTAQCLDELHRLFDVRYPWGEYHQAFVPDFNAGAMENPGCVTFRDSLVFRSRATQAERDSRANTIAHEMAHMWFGDLVTMRWWDDLWLNESFAEYIGYRVCAATGNAHAWADFGIERKGWGYAADRRPSTHPVAGNAAEDAESALNEFDGISYAKGAAVLRQLATRLGDDVLLAGLRRHFAEHRFGSATFADLIRSWTAAGAADLPAWAEQWLRTAGLDTLRAEPVAGGSVVRRDSDTDRLHAVTIAAYAADGTVLAREQTVVSGEVTVAHPPAALVLADAADETWAKLAIADWSGAASVLPRLEPVSRVALWNALQLAAADAEIAPQQVLDIVEAAAPEGDNVLARVLAWAVRTVAGTYVPAEARADALDRLTVIAQRALDAAEPGSGRQLAAARAVTSASLDGQLLRSWSAGDAPAGLVVDTDLRWLLLQRLAALGELSEAEIVVAETEDRSSAGAVHAAQCRALRPDPDGKAAVWQQLMHDRSVSNYELYALADGFWHPLQQAVTEPFVERYFAEIAATAELRSGWVAARVAGYAFPWTAVAQATLHAADSLLGRADLRSGIRRAVADATDDLRRAVRVREKFAG